MQKIHSFTTKCALYLSLVFASLLFISGFLSTSYSTDMASQKVLYKWDNPIFGILGILVFLGIMALILHISSGNEALTKKVLLYIAFGWFILLGGIFFIFCRSVPSADAYTVYLMTQNFAIGDTSAIHPTASYLAYYPQQVGLIAFWEPLIRLWNLLPINFEAYHFLKIVYLGLSLVIFYFQYLTVHFLFKKDKVDIIFILISMINIPFIMYTSYIYSEIPSLAAISVGIYFFLKFNDAVKQTSPGKTCLYFILAVLSLTVSVLFRKNALIIIIAVLIISFFGWVGNYKQKSRLLFTIILAICSLSILPLVTKFYEWRGNNTLNSGVTATSYIAMGMQDTGRGAGWYNSFNFTTFEESGWNAEKANEISRAAIAERLQYFSDNPAYTARFYLEKFLSQWTDGTYAARQALLAEHGGRAEFFNNLLNGPLGNYLIYYCNSLQNILYLGCVICFLGLRKGNLSNHTDKLTCCIFMIDVFGGFLFHMLWEANSRYIFTYGMLLIPYAAVGLSQLSEFIRNIVSKYMSKNNSQNA